MIKIVYAMSTLALVCAGLLLGLTGAQFLRGEQDTRGPVITDREQFLMSRKCGTNSHQASNSLMEAAAAFALYLNPPKPSMPAPVTSQPAVVPLPAPRPLRPVPQFQLLAISYYRSSPEKSLAMVWDASKGSYWVKKGDRLGQFVIERIEKQAIVYRNGDQLSQMAMVVKEPVSLGRLKTRESAPSQKAAPNEVLVSASK